MTIQEAIGTGKRFKRPSFNYWIEFFHRIPYAIYEDTPEKICVPRVIVFTEPSILAIDWIIDDDSTRL
jgi:hypothetical protein